MLELGISEAQTEFTKLLNKQVTIIDKKNKSKKAVILPYDVYSTLIKKTLLRENYLEGSFSKFSGLLSKDFKSDDERYNDIVSENN